MSSIGEIKNKSATNVKIEFSWKKKLTSEFEKPYFKNLVFFLKSEYASKNIYPNGRQIFYAFEKTPFDQIKVVILGQDPYHGYKQANGLCFSVNDGIPLPPSLKNIYTEIQKDMKITPPLSGNLERWAIQGILLLNSVLTVQANRPGSHRQIGWEKFTDSIIHKIACEKQNIVFILWGSYAQKKEIFIDSSKHLILKSSHPSPLSANRGFFGSCPFSRTNDFLLKTKQAPIVW